MAIKDWQSLLGIQFQLWVVEEADKIETLDQRQRSGPSHSGLEKCRYHKHSNDNKLDGPSKRNFKV